MKRDEATAVAAEKVMVMLAAGADPLISRGPASEVEPLEEAGGLQLLQRPIDARPPDLWEAGIDLRRSQRA